MKANENANVRGSVVQSQQRIRLATQSSTVRLSQRANFLLPDFQTEFRLRYIEAAGMPRDLESRHRVLERRTSNSRD